MKNGSTSSTVRFILGIIGMVIFGGLLTASLVTLLLTTLFFALPLSIVFGVIFLLSGALMGSGLRRKKLINRLSRYMAELSAKQEVMSIEDMTALTGVMPTTIRNDIRRLKRLDLNFDLYSDKAESTLMKGKGSYDLYIETERQRVLQAREEDERKNRLKDPNTSSLEVFRVEGSAFIDKIHAANILLPGEEISNSLYELERTAKRIFEHVDNNPEKLPETRKLMSYHLPTLMKLIEKYCEYDSLEYQPQNVADAKADIEDTLSKANEAFTNFLDSLYHIETLDVTTDAVVLTKMFEKDGLTGSNFSIKGEEK